MCNRPMPTRELYERPKPDGRAFEPKSAAAKTAVKLVKDLLDEAVRAYEAAVSSESSSKYINGFIEIGNRMPEIERVAKLVVKEAQFGLRE